MGERLAEARRRHLSSASLGAMNLRSPIQQRATATTTRSDDAPLLGGGGERSGGLVSSPKSLRDLRGSRPMMTSSVVPAVNDARCDAAAIPLQSSRRIGSASAPRVTSPPLVHSALWFHPREHHQLSNVAVSQSGSKLLNSSEHPVPLYNRGGVVDVVDDSVLTTQRQLFQSSSLAVLELSPVRSAPVLRHSPSPSAADAGVVPVQRRYTDGDPRDAPNSGHASIDMFGATRPNKSAASSDASVVHPRVEAASSRKDSDEHRPADHPRRQAAVHSTAAISSESQTDVCRYTSFWITVWPAFLRVSRPYRVFVSPKTMFFQTVLEHAAVATQCTPAPTYLYTPSGVAVRDLHQLAVEGDYLIAPSAVQYHQDMVPRALLERLVRKAKATAEGRTLF
jgi:hypothetical protein